MGTEIGTRLELIQILDDGTIRVWVALNKRVNPTLGTFINFYKDGSIETVTLRPDNEERLLNKEPD